VAAGWAGCETGTLGVLVVEGWKANVGGPVAAVTPQDGAVGGIQGGQSLAGEEHRACRPGGHLQQPRDVLLPGGCGADADGSRGQVTRGWGRGDLGGRIRECVNQQHRDHQRDSGAQDGGEPANHGARWCGIARQGTEAGGVVGGLGARIHAVADTPQQQVGGGEQPESEGNHGHDQQQSQPDRRLFVNHPPATAVETGRRDRTHRDDHGRDDSPGTQPGGQQPENRERGQYQKMRRDGGQEQGDVAPERDHQESRGGDDPQPRQPQIPETRNETRRGIRGGDGVVGCRGHVPLSTINGERGDDYREMPSPALQSWLSRPATKELVVSKPWWGCPRCWGWVCLSAAGWFRLGSFVPHDPAQPVS